MANTTAWVGPERDAARHLRPVLRPFLRLARMTHSFAERALRLRSAVPLDRPAQIQCRLMVQASNQLRILELAAERGYALQALGSAATLYEHVSALAYIHADAAKAAEWFAHQDFEESYPPPKKRAAGIRRMLAASGVPGRQIESLVRTWEDHHTRFCAAKHGNPVLLRKYAVTPEGKWLKLHLGPIAGPESTTLSRMALYHGARLLADASVLLASPASGAHTKSAREFRTARRRVLNRINELAVLGAAPR